MFKLVKWMLGFLVTLVVLILVAVVVAPMVFDPNDYRDDISALVKEQTGRELTLDGELKLSVFPWLGIRTEGLALSQPSEIGGDLLSVNTAQLRVKLAPLLSRQVHVDTVILEQPSVRLVTLKNGTDSFSGLVSADEQVDRDDQSSHDSSSTDVAVALLIQGVKLNGGQVVIDDRVAGSKTEISNLNLETGNLIGESLVDLRASGRMTTSDSPDVVEFKMTSLANIDVETLLIKLAETQIQVLQGENDITLGLDALTFAEQTKVDASGLMVNTQGMVEAALTAPSITADLDTQRATVRELTITSGEFNGQLTDFVATDFVDAPKASGRLSVPEFNAAKLLRDFDIDYQTSDANALKKVALNARFNGSLEGASVDGLELVLDDSRLTGSASVKNFEKPAATFDLLLNVLNLDNYLPLSDETEAVDDEQSGSVADALAVPMGVFKDIQANGQFKAKTLVAGGVELKDIDVQVRSSAGQVTITPSAGLYDGSLAGKIAFTEDAGTSKLAIKNEVDLVQLGKLLNAADVSDQLSGIGSVLVDLVVTEVNGVQTNQGVIKLQAKDGAVQGIDIKGMVDTAYAKYQSLRGKEPTGNEEGTSEASDETKFAELLGTFNVNNNVITNDDFSLKAPLFRVSGEGTIDVAKETLDYLVEVKLVASTKGQGGESVDKLAGIPIPIRLSGDLTAPGYSVDFKRIYKSLFEREVERKKGEYLQEKLGIEGGEKLSTKGVLKSLLSNKIDKKLNKSDGVSQERVLTERKETGDADQHAIESEQEQPQMSAEDQLKEDLKNKLLDGLFGK